MQIDMKAIFVDLFDKSKKRITQLKGKGHIVICSFSAGRSESWRSDYQQKKNIWEKVKAKQTKDWEGEVWLDITKFTQLTELMQIRLELARDK
eukprot:Pgem_evm1s15554